jgi:hypothetical protein
VIGIREEDDMGEVVRVELGGKEAMNNLTNVLEKVSHDFVRCVVFYFIVLDVDLDLNFKDIQNKSESTKVDTSQICMRLNLK